MRREISDEMLNAFVDGELDSPEAEQLFEAMQLDTELSNRICLLRGMKGLTRLAYGHPPQREQRRVAKNWAQIGAVAAAVLVVFTLGFGGGWWLKPLPAESGWAMGLQGLTPAQFRQAARSGKVILHIDSGDEERLTIVLDSVEKLLADAAAAGRDPEVEVVANSYGLDLLREESSPFARRVTDLSLRYSHLSFVACGQTVARLQREGAVVKLLPEAQMVPSAVGQIVSRMQQGWIYIKV
ncbi:MAG: hypothetical protein ACFCUG_07105 [Thiotrichales bacterium]